MNAHVSGRGAVAGSTEGCRGLGDVFRRRALVKGILAGVIIAHTYIKSTTVRLCRWSGTRPGCQPGGQTFNSSPALMTASAQINPRGNIHHWYSARGEKDMQSLQVGAESSSLCPVYRSSSLSASSRGIPLSHRDPKSQIFNERHTYPDSESHCERNPNLKSSTAAIFFPLIPSPNFRRQRLLAIQLSLPLPQCR